MISFRKMTEEEYNSYYISALNTYANDLLKCGRSTSENSPAISEKDFNEALPFGFHTANAYFYVILNADDDEIGFIWYAELPDRIAYIGDFLIYEKHRKNGYGLQALKQLLEEKLILKKIKAIALNVFDFNTGAINLYKKMGLEEIKAEHGCVQMVKSLIS